MPSQQRERQANDSQSAPCAQGLTTLSVRTYGPERLSGAGSSVTGDLFGDTGALNS